MKGIILAGGSGSRLYPSTLGISKQLLPIYDKPMIYYPLSVLMLTKIQEVLIISTPQDTPRFKEIFGSGKWLGMNIQYAVQNSPDGLAQGLILAESFIKDSTIAMILGDNIFYGQGFSNMLLEAKDWAKKGVSSIFSYPVNDPWRFGVVEFDKMGAVKSLEEKPKNPKSKFAATGLYFYDNSAISIAKTLKPSSRGELEITDVNLEYLAQNRLRVQNLGRGFAWIDSGTHDSLLEAGSFVQMIELRQGYKVACLEEIAYNNGWIDREQVLKRATYLKKSSYGAYLHKILEEF